MSPLPDNFSSRAFARAWGYDKATPRSPDATEQAFADRLRLYADHVEQAARTLETDLANLPRQLAGDTYADATGNAVDAANGLYSALASLRAAIRDIEAVPVREAKEAEDAKWGGEK